MDDFQTFLYSILEYDDVTGHLIWKVKYTDKIVPGTRAGSVARNGYRQIKVNHKVYNEHRLIWFYVYGYWPTELDHINQDKQDNRILNLREVSRSINSLNKSKPSKNSSHKYRGVRFDRTKYTATLTFKGTTYRLGRFLTPEEASKAYEEAKTKLLEENT